MIRRCVNFLGLKICIDLNTYMHTFYGWKENQKFLLDLSEKFYSYDHFTVEVDPCSCL